MKDKIFIITTIVLFVALIVAGFFILDYSSTNGELSYENQKLEGNLEDVVEELETAEEQVEILEEENSTQADELADLLAQLETLTSDLEEESDELDELTAEYRALEDESTFLMEFTYCDAKYTEGLDIDYSSNETVSQTLTTWWEGYREGSNVTEATWRSFWKGLDISIHNLYYTVDGSGSYLHTFLVFYNVEDYTGGIYFIYYQCWLEFQE